MSTSAPSVEAHIDVSKNFGGGHDYLVKIVTDEKKIVAYENGWRPVASWAASVARRKAKRMLRDEKRRLTKDKENDIHVTMRP